jgi:hypothetical protein
MSDGAKKVLKIKKDKGCYSTLKGRYLKKSDIKFREFFNRLERIFLLVLNEIKADIKKKNNKIRNTNTTNSSSFL